MPDAQSILAPLNIPQGVKADAFDAYTSSKSVDDLAARLMKLPLPKTVRADLWDAKSAETPTPSSSAKPNAGGGWSLEHNPLSDTLAGIGSGVISTGVGAYNLARKIPGVDQVLPAPNTYVQGLTKAPASLAGSAGRFAEQAGEFMVPMGKVAKAAEAAPLAVRLAAEALAAGGISGVQTGGNVPAMAESAATTGVLGGVGAAIPAGAKAALAKAISNSVRPLSEGAQALAQKYGVPLTQGMLSGSRTIQAVEKMVGHSVAPDLYEPILAQAQEGLNKGAQDLAGNLTTDKFSAGQKTLDAMLGTAQDHEHTAATEYANLAAAEADPANTRVVQVGTKPNPSQDPTGPERIPDLQPVGLPTDMRPVKAAIAPEIANLERAMTPAQRNMDPGLTALKNIMARPDALPASVAERDLGYLKDINRSDASPQAKRLATIAANALQPAIDAGVSVGGADTLDSLQNARGSWAARSSILDNIRGLTAGDVTGRTGQVNVVNKLTHPADASFPALEQVLNAAPNAGEEIGKAFLGDRVFGKLAQDGADFTTPNQARNIWNQLGPRTKAALYTPETIKNVNDFLELSRRVAENPNPSGTGVVNTLLKAGVLITHPVQGAAAFAFGRNIAKVLYNPEAANNLRVALEQAGSPAGSQALRAVQSIMNSNESAAVGNGSPALP